MASPSNGSARRSARLALSAPHRKSTRLAGVLTLLIAATWTSSALAQAPSLEPLDPTATLPLTDPPRVSLPEQYIWTAGDVTAERPDHSRYPWNRTELRTAPHDFRTHFTLSAVPSAATLYLAGPREATVYLNGRRLGHFATSPDQPINFRVFHADAAGALHTGENVLAIRAVRGRGVVTVSNSKALQQLAYGEVLAVKLVPGIFGDDRPEPLLRSDAAWRSTVGNEASASWYAPTLDDSAWPRAQSIGGVESNVDFRQWSADAGMYGWPGFMGMSETLRTYTLPPAQVQHIFPGDGSFANPDSLKQLAPSAPFTVSQPSPGATDAEAPSLLLDFGREVAGRLLVESASDTDSLLSIAYGESELEAMATGITPEARGGNYLGTNLLDVPARGIARGPKSGFRYVRVRFLRTGAHASFPQIRLEGIAYPVAARASFTSSDPVLNRIYEVAAYTAHLCMQDGVWDAVKRDRGRWAGDLDIESPAIYNGFGDSAAVEDTLARLAQDTPRDRYADGIPSYTALWLTTLGQLYQLSADRAFVTAHHDDALRMLARLDADLDPATGLLKPGQSGWGFVDWSPGLYGNTPEVGIGTTLQYLRAYTDAPALLRAAGDDANAARYQQTAAHLRQAARQSFLSPETHTAGATWQLNALAVLTNLEDTGGSAMWNAVFSRVQQKAPSDPVISPYFNAYLIEAMSATGHPREALDWMRAYWGGMLAEGATSFWESYDLRWPKTDPHLSLQADGTSGFFVSLAHGWSSGPVTWITENILGVRPLSPGYASVTIAPRLLGLGFARGAVPTPHGMISVALDSTTGLTLDLPTGVESAAVSLEPPPGGRQLLVNGTPASRPASLGLQPVHLDHSGRYNITWK